MNFIKNNNISKAAVNWLIFALLFFLACSCCAAAALYNY
jgi:hypothetical protein